jgi:hypothetical protein
MKTFKNKTELIDFVNHQVHVKLENDTDCRLNNNRNRLYTQITRINHNRILMLLRDYNIRYEFHVHDYYWIFIK